MKRKLLAWLACPDCSGAVLSLEDWAVASPQDVQEGLIRCGSCSGHFPVIGGVPRMLPSHLRWVLKRHYPDYFRRHPDVQLPPRDSNDRTSAIVKTLEYYSFQHIDLSIKEMRPELLPLWMKGFQDRILLPPQRFQARLVLDAGCGEGRFPYCAHQWGAEVIGMDLSKAVDYASAKNETNERVHIVQGDILHPPFRDGTFDLIYSTGVLHHLPDPAEGFQKLSKKVAPGGEIAAWVYGLQGMNLSYRLSHLTLLRGIGPHLPRSVSLSVSWGLAAIAEVASRLTGRGRLPGVRRWVPEQLQEFALLPFRLKAKEFYDRIAVPVTHFLDRDDLRAWILGAGLTEVDISPTKGRGWCARALRT